MSRSPFVRLFTIATLFLFVLNACAPAATPVATEAVEPTVSAPTATKTAVPTATKTPAPTRTPVPATPTITSTPLAVLQESEYKVRANRYREVGSTIGNVYAYDKTLNTLLFIPQGIRMQVTAKEDTVITMVVYNKASQEAVIAEAEKAYPNAEKFLATFTLNNPDGWQNAVLPDGWKFYFVPNELRHNKDLWQSPVENGRLGIPQYSYAKITCAEYEEDPGNLPEGIRFDQDYNLQIIGITGGINAQAVCGNRENGVLSIDAETFGLILSVNEDETVVLKEHSEYPDEYLHLMEQVFSLYHSPVLDANGDMVKDEFGTYIMVMDFQLNDPTNFARFVIGPAIAGWPSAPAEWTLQK